MKSVIQRVKKASLRVDEKLISKINAGLVIFLGIGKNDNDEKLSEIALKISKLRIFEDENGKMNLSIKDVGGEVLLVSQFTLFADCSHGNRPSFFEAQNPIIAEKLYKNFGKMLEKLDISVKYGVFGEDMQILQTNDGPVTIYLEG